MKPITIPIPQGELIAIIPESDGNYIYNSTENKPIVFDYESIKNLRHTPIEVMRGDIEIIGKWSEITEEMAERWGFERIHYESNHMPSNENLLLNSHIS